MVRSKPRVSVGLPVYNGEKYLEQAIDSILTQTYTDFELIISDNASRDRTQQICRTYASKDERVRYFRNETNIGANRNFNRVFELSSGEYFKWAACDDVHAPEFVERCVEVLDRDPSVVLCYPRTIQIDTDGQVLGPLDFDVDATSLRPSKRFYNMIHIDHWCFQIFGVMRASVLRMTPCLGSHYGADRVLLAEISLLGRICELQEYLFFRRDHGQTSWQIVSSGDGEDLVAYFGADTAKRAGFWGFNNFHGYFAAANRAPLRSSERLLCYAQLLRLATEKTINRLRRRWFEVPT